MNNIFYNCIRLTSIDISNFNTKKLKYMSAMFSNCFDLTSIDISNFDTSKVEDMSNLLFLVQN